MDKETFNVISGCLIGMLLVTAASTLGIILNGLALTWLWSWFIVPLGLPELSIAWAIGISLIFSFLSTVYSESKENKFDVKKTLGEKLIESATWTFGKPILYLLPGYVVHQFM